MRVGNLIPQTSPNMDTWVKIYENELGSAETSVTISGLDGNTDVMYRLRWRIIGAVNSDSFHFRINGDSGTNNGKQNLRGTNAVVVSQRYTLGTTFPLLEQVDSMIGNVSEGVIILYAKSGYVRTAIAEFTEAITATTVGCINISGFSWNNTTDNITSLVVLANQASGLGIGTVLELFKVVPKV